MTRSIESKLMELADYSPDLFDDETKGDEEI